MGISLAFNYVLLCIIAAVALGLSIFAGIYVLVYWSEKTEVWNTLLPRIVVVICLMFVYFIPSVIPLDVAIKYLSPELDFMNVVWQVVVYLTMGLAIVVLPFILFTMEERLNYEKGRCCKAMMGAFFQTLVCVFVVMALAVILYFTIGKAELEMPLWREPTGVAFSADFDFFAAGNRANTNELVPSARVNTKALIPLSFASYLIAIFSFLGSVLFTVFFGIGLAALPLDWINVFRKRPKVMSKQQLVVFRNKFATRSKQLLSRIDEIYAVLLKENFGEDRVRMKYCIEQNNLKELFGRQTKLRKEYEKIKRTSMDLYTVYEEIILMNQKETANPLKYFARLFVGVFALLFSLLIFAQLLAVMINQFNKHIFMGKDIFFLAYLLRVCQEAVGVPLISTLLFSVFSLYVTFCFVKGVTKFGFRFILFIEIHPMKMGKTELTSFIFNSLIMTIGILPQLQFLTYIFQDFSYGAAVDLLFSQTVSNIQYLKEWFNWYIVVMNCLFVLTFLCLLACPGEDVYDSLDSILKADSAKGESISRVKHTRKAKKEIAMTHATSMA